jgi:hypothetical protein
MGKTHDPWEKSIRNSGNMEESPGERCEVIMKNVDLNCI